MHFTAIFTLLTATAALAASMHREGADLPVLRLVDVSPCGTSRYATWAVFAEGVENVCNAQDLGYQAREVSNRLGLCGRGPFMFDGVSATFTGCAEPVPDWRQPGMPTGVSVEGHAPLVCERVEEMEEMCPSPCEGDTQRRRTVMVCH
jgi:hypothetical protein